MKKKRICRPQSKYVVPDDRIIHYTRLIKKWTIFIKYQVSNVNVKINDTVKKILKKNKSRRENLLLLTSNFYEVSSSCFAIFRY